MMLKVLLALAHCGGEGKRGENDEPKKKIISE